MLSLLALAVAPGTAIVLYIYSRDKYDREPLKPLLLSFVLGMAAILPAMWLQRFMQPYLISWFPGFTLSYFAILAFIVVACTEESCKFLVLRSYAYPHKAFNEPFDGIIYAVMISMGFATLENTMYVLQFGFKTGLVRMFLSVPSHAAFGVLMGYHSGLAKFKHDRKMKRIFNGLLLAIFFHGAFDFFLFLQNSLQIRQLIPNKYLLNGLLISCALICYGIVIRMALRSIRLHEALSKETFHEKETVPVTYPT